jgi:osmoprotectant transport system permease protein
MILILSMSFVTPLLTLKANRVSNAENLFYWQTGIPWMLMIPMFLPLFWLILSLRKPQLRISRAVESFLPVACLFLAIYILIIQGTYLTGPLDSLQRIGLGPGLYLYLFAASIFPLSKSKRNLSWSFFIGLMLLALIIKLGLLDHLGIIQEAQVRRSRLIEETFNHMKISLISLMISMIIGLPFAMMSYKNRLFKNALFPVINTLQTIPSMALFGLMMAPLALLSRSFPILRQWGVGGLGNTPAIIALSIYALYPVIRYSFTALDEVDAQVVDAARGMGMNSKQLWRYIRIPLGLPVILQGIRVAFVQTLGNATLAKLIDGDGLGTFVFQGLGQASPDLVLLGMILIIILTLSSDFIFEKIIIRLTPKGLRSQYQREEMQ